MGNSASSSDSEDEGRALEYKDVDDGFSDSEEMGDKDGSATTDLNCLFSDPATLRTVAAKIKERIPENVIHQHHALINRWLRERMERAEETVTLAQFCFLLMPKGVSKEEAIKAFQPFDTDGNGTAEVVTMLDAVSTYTGPNLMGELGKNIRMLQACSLLPGFVDVYAGDTNPIMQHGEKILKYLLRNRAEVSTLPFPHLNGFNNTCSMRLSVLRNIFNTLKDAARDDGEDQVLAEGEELKTISKCFSHLEVSTNSSDAYRLWSSSDSKSFWQSDGAARSHWIRLHIRSNVVIKHLSIAVASSDQSYMPELVTVTGGRTPRSLRELKEVRIPGHFTGDVVLLKNAKVHYPILQINIKRCHSDGCDTRVHGLKTLGYKVVREVGVSVMDASAKWYLQVLATTVSCSLPHCPALRSSVMQHTKNALEHMPPLSLGQSSGDRPQFLSRHVLEEMESFITDLTTTDSKLMVEGLHLLLSLNLARGHVAALVRTIKHFSDNPDLSLSCMPLMMKMMDIRNNCWERMGSPLQVTLAGCDGGKTEESTAPAEVLSYGFGTTQNTTYFSEEGKTKVNMFFKSNELIQVTKIRIKVASGGRGPRRGFVFVFNHDQKEFKLEEAVERFAAYDKWAELEYRFSLQYRAKGLGGMPDNPVAYFTFDDDCDEIDVPVHWYPTAQHILVKFLEPREKSCVKLGIVGIKFFGFLRTHAFLDDNSKGLTGAPSKQSLCSSVEVVQWLITFLIHLSQDQGKKKGKLCRPDFLDYSNLELETLCKLYMSFHESSDEKWKNCSLLLLELLHRLIPHLSVQNASCKETAENLFKHLCTLIDDPELDHKSKVFKLAEQLIVDGASLFFPDKESKRQQLFSMMGNVEKLATAPSVTLVFQSLCQFFSTVDPHGLLDLPKLPTETFDGERVLEVLGMLVVVAGQELALAMTRAEDNVQISHLIRLISALQTSLLVWCWQHLTDTDASQALKNTASKLLVSYSTHVSAKAVEACELLQTKDKEKLEECLKSRSPAFLSSVVRQLVLMTMYLVDCLDSKARVSILKSFYVLFQKLSVLEKTAPSLFPEMTSDNWRDMKNEDIVLRTWEVESPHNYDNNSSITQVFSCPGSTQFIIDFDPRCETERRYDYLEFTDAKGVKVRYDQKVGTNKWPKQVHFSGPHLHFIFRSDSSNTEWGYKFKVTAKGSPDVPLSWAYDLQLGLSRLFGCLCGATLAANPVLPTESLLLLEDNVDQDVLRSELWTTLFRGGYMMGGKLQRSLSGKMYSDECSTALLLLNELIQHSDTPELEGSTDIRAKAQKLRAKCLELRPKTAVGGKDIDAAVWSVFAALIWHTQQLREDMEKFYQNPEASVVSEGVLQAYTSAESLRLELLRQRQKLAAQEELSRENNPVLTCKEKAVFLLKFGGLTKVQLKMELRSKTIKMALKKSGNKRNDKLPLRMDIAEKFPSFRLVMEFVMDPAWTTDRVHQMLQERTNFASCLSDIYVFSAEFIRTVSKDQDIFQIPVVLFLQWLLSYQDRFAKHYADGLDGCGLEQEKRVRQGYYSLIRCLLQPFRDQRPHNLYAKVLPAYDFIQACLLHLLDTHWMAHDLDFITDLQLPDLFFTLAKDTVKMRDIMVGSGGREEELREYEVCMKWFEECYKGSSDFNSWYAIKEDQAKDERKAVQMFVARFCDLLDVEITCDGCGVTLPGRRYRCVQCVDMDLCTTCYSGGVKPAGEHNDDHDFVHLVYKCNKCQAFIVGTRIHCNDCEDFDLCLGCHTKGKFPSGHLATHDVTEIPMVKLRNSQSNDSLIKAYIHQHLWLLFTSLSLGLSEMIYSSHPLDPDYVKQAAALQNKCITIVAHCLQTVPRDADDVIVGTPNLRVSTLPIEARQDEAFATHSQERIMGLLGSMIPPRDKDPVAETSFIFTDEKFVNLLLKVSKGDSGHDNNTQHLAMGLLARVLASSDSKISGSHEEGKKTTSALTAGKETISHFFTAGASCIDSNMEWSSSVARLLGTLCQSTVWRPAVHSHISASIDTLRKKPDRKSMYALFVMAGFPEVLSIGTLVEYCHVSLETKKGVVIKHFTDKHQTLVVDLHSRKRCTVKDQYISCSSEVMELWDDSHMSEFTAVIMETVTKIRAGEEVSVESLWVLALVLKVLHNLLKSDNIFNSPQVFCADFIQCLVFIASKGTGFSQQWLLKDLEVLSLNLYTSEDQPPAAKKAKISTKKEPEPKKVETKSDTGDDDNDDDNDDDDHDDDDDDDDEDMIDIDSMSSSTTSWEDEEETKDIFAKADTSTREIFQALHHELKVPMSVLHVVYDMHEGKIDAIKKALMDNFEHSPEITAFMDRWNNGEVATSKSSDKDTASQEKVIDTGIFYHPDLTRGNSNPSTATEETGSSHQDLFVPPKRMVGEITEQRRNKSADLLKRELLKYGRFASREYLAKVNLAIAVLYARHVLTGLLAHWPRDGPVINAGLLGCKELHQIPCVLDLLYKADNRDFFNKVVEKVIQHCDEVSLVPIAYTASQFMEEVTLSSVTKESSHNYSSGQSPEKIQLPGASFLTVSFDSKCSTAVDADILSFSTSEDFRKDIHHFSGSKPRWNSFQVPGDTIYYKFIKEDCSKDDSCKYWGFKFTVIAGISDSFETGHTILESILASPMTLSLPLGEIWRSLACVACKQTSSQRLKAVQLLLHIVVRQQQALGRKPPTKPPAKDPLSLPAPLNPTPAPKLAVDLSLLRPLWNLYNKMSARDREAGGMQPPVVRALTELFLQTENLALELDMVDEYLAAMANVQDIKDSIMQGVTNLAVVSASIGEKTSAVEMLEAAGFKVELSCTVASGDKPEGTEIW